MSPRRKARFIWWSALPFTLIGVALFLFSIISQHAFGSIGSALFIGLMVAIHFQVSLCPRCKRYQNFRVPIKSCNQCGSEFK